MKKDDIVPTDSEITPAEPVKLEIVELDDLDLADVAGGGKTKNSTMCTCTNTSNCSPTS
ncbi:MAG: hypothetical protein QM820_44290 [Minicystis sp.]